MPNNPETSKNPPGRAETAGWEKQLQSGGGQLDAALRDFDAALTSDVANYRAAAGRAAILESQKKHAEALAAYDQVVEIARADWQRLDGYLGRARMLAALGRNQEARKILEAARLISFRMADQLQQKLFP
jgi:tetratricopeptide (TPR) repeat protein